MEQRLWMILQLFGGAALFLYSMDTLTDALQQAAGDTLRQALARLTAHPLAGVLTGAAVTAVVQSSSAVTVLVLGLVGAGLLTLQRAVPVVFGANIGTTVTAQLLAFRLEDARYLLLVAGLLLWFAGRGRLHAAGQALFAFCCLRASRSWPRPWSRWQQGRCSGIGWPRCGIAPAWACWQGWA